MESDVRDGTLILFGQKVRALRTALGWSQADLAQRMTAWGHRLHQTQIAKIEAGERVTTIDELAGFARILEVDVGDLVSTPVNDEGRRVIEGEEMLVRKFDAQLKQLNEQIEELTNRRDDLRSDRSRAAQRLRTAQKAYGMVPYETREVDDA